MDAKLKEKIDERSMMTGAVRPNPVYCRKCKYAHGKAPWADAPEKANCVMFPYGVELKPRDVLFDGAECDFYEEKSNGNDN